MTSRVAMPGLRTPGAGFDQPFEMLAACHERVVRTLDLLQRLQAYVADQGVDDNARQAARDVLRYFDQAAPLHHEDEELHVFPPLLRPASDAATQAVVRQLQQDHVDMAACWALARQPLQALAEGLQAVFSAADSALLQRFAALYGQHLRHEDQLIYPAARAVLDVSSQQAMGREMAVRRGAEKS
ncbi:MAG: hemerythrin domain-containing protein [Acidovorax sp.]|jgi:hemerythrin-like domain-containing protein|nr:hemerythrin domain-containing protein [Acidovorax sp.]